MAIASGLTGDRAVRALAQRVQNVVWVALLLIASAAAAVGAQEPLRVLDRLPRDVARPSDVITITFDRPVAGSLEHTVDPARIVRLEPAVRVRVEWRDPSTIRIVPLDPLQPGQRYTVTVDTTFDAFDGSRLAAPERFTLAVRGPRLVGSVPYLEAQYGASLMDPTGRLWLAFSAPVADSVLHGTVRLSTRATQGCTVARTIAYRVVRQRPVQSGDPWELQPRYVWPPDTLATRFHRVVELQAEDPLPEACRAELALPSLDSLDATTVRYEVKTARAFGLDSLECQGDCQVAKGVMLRFDAPVAPRALLAAVHFEPAAAFSPAAPDGPVSDWNVAATLSPRSTYRVTVDSSLRDIYDRPLSFGFVKTLTLGDRASDFGHHAGLVLVSAHPVPTIRLRHVNVDSVALLLMPVPEGDRVRHLLPRRWWLTEHLPPLPDTIVKVVALHAPFNEERVSKVALPELGGRLGGRLVALQARLQARTHAPDEASPSTGATSHGKASAPIVVFAGGDGTTTPMAFLQATDLMVHARLTASGVLVWVTSARDGHPVRSARVAVLDTAGVAVSRGVTNDRGVAELMFRQTVTPSREPEMFEEYDLPREDARAEVRFLEVHLGNDRSLTDLGKRSGMDISNAELAATFDDAWLRLGKDTHAVVFADRGIYRPGERVQVGAVMREGMLGSLRAPNAGDTARVRMMRTAMDGTSETLRDTVVRVSQFGTMTDSIQLPAHAVPGDSRVTVALVRNGAWQEFGSTRLRVAEYRAPEFLVTAHADSAPRVRGDTIATQVSAAYLFGAPMAGMEVFWNARFGELDPWELNIPGVGREWAIGRQGTWWERDTIPHAAWLNGVDTLDAQGVARLRIGTDSVVPGRGSSARVDVSVADVNRQFVTASVGAIVHPASFYLALHDSASAWWWPVRVAQRMQLMAVRPDGRKVAGVKVRVAVVSYRWSAPDTAKHGNLDYAWRADTVRVDTLDTADSVRTFLLPTLREGPVTVVATAMDERGRAVITTMGRYVYGGAGIAGGSPMRLPLRVQRARLAPGDSAVVSFTSPWPAADAWVTVEREGVLREQVLRGVRGAVTLRLPMTEREVPNAFVSVFLVRRGPIGVTDSAALRMRIGYAALRVDDASRRLAVRVRALRAEYAPGDSATIEVTVRDARGQGTVTEATVWAVDEGVLALTGFTTPDLMRQLYAPVSDGVTLASTLRSLPSGIPAWQWRRARWLGQFGAANNAFSVQTAPSPAADRSMPRSDFHTTAFFRGGVVTGANGVARITVKLPENITTFRLMAVAVSAHDQYGSAEAPLLVTKPLIVRGALPRFMRAGDSVFAGAVINARDGRPRSIDVTASGAGVTLVGDSVSRTMLAAIGTEARFAWRGIAGDSARFLLRATDGEHADAVAISIPMKPDQSPRSRTISGMVRDSATIRFRLPRNLDPARSRLTIRTGTSPVPTLRVARDFLLAGSYSCPDQLTSAGRMLVSLLSLERRGTKVLGDTLWARRELQHIADEIARRDRASWHMWCWEAPWEGSPVRAAANLLMLDMRDIGVQIDTAMVRRIAKSFTRLLDSVPLFPDTTYGRREERRFQVADHLQGRLGAAEFLRRTGVSRERELRQLRENATRLTWEDRAWLAEVLEQSGDHAGARTLLDQLWSSLGEAGNRVDVPDSVLSSVGFPSHVRPVARLLGATLAIAPEHPRLGALVERLTTRQRAERDEWWNTQDHVSATVALTRFAMRPGGRGGPVSVQVGRGTAATGRAAITLASEAAQDTSVTLAGLTEIVGDSAEVTVRLKVVGGAQFYAITVGEMLKERPTAPASRGLIVERWYERFDDGRTVTELREGDLVRVRLRVTVPASREFVAVEDVLPAGLEAVDLTLRTSGTLGPFASRESEAVAQRRDAEAGGTPGRVLYGSWLGGWWSPWAAPETHDERTVFFARKLWPGSFVLSYVARATTAGRFVRPQAHAEEVYNRAVNGRSEGGWFVVRPASSAAIDDLRPGTTAGTSCVPIDSASLDERQTFADIATGTDAESASLRLLYKLPAVADSAVVLVQDPRDCAQALLALNRQQNRSHSEGLRAVLVIRVGTVFVVSDPAYRVGEFTAYTVFDSRFKNVLASVAR